jgi:hypothetical protein
MLSVEVTACTGLDNEAIVAVPTAVAAKAQANEMRTVRDIVGASKNRRSEIGIMSDNSIKLEAKTA